MVGLRRGVFLKRMHFFSYSMNMATVLPPVSREQAFLETYFQCLSQLAYDKAKEACVSVK